MIGTCCVPKCMLKCSSGVALRHIRTQCCASLWNIATIYLFQLQHCILQSHIRVLFRLIVQPYFNFLKTWLAYFVSFQAWEGGGVIRRRPVFSPEVYLQKESTRMCAYRSGFWILGHISKRILTVILLTLILIQLSAEKRSIGAVFIEGCEVVWTTSKMLLTLHRAGVRKTNDWTFCDHVTSCRL